MDEKQVQEILKAASRFRKVPVTRAALVEVSRLLYENKHIDLWDIYKNSEGFLEIVIGIIETLRRKRFLAVKNKEFYLTPKGKKFTKELIVKGRPKKLICKPEWIKLNAEYKKILLKVRRIYKGFTPKDKYDQAPLLPEAAVWKVAYGIQKGDIAGKSVVCIGDDDFISLILALTEMPKDVLAIDVDTEVLGLIKGYAKKLKVPVKTLRHDLRKPIPKEYRNKFDTFITEPPDTVLGYCLFVSRGVELLKKEPGMAGYAGLTPTACPLLGLLAVQEKITKMGLVISDYLPKFSIYPSVRTELKDVYVPDYVEYPPTKPWYVSDLIRLRTTKVTKPLYKAVTSGIANYRQDSLFYR